ncbi:diacylglycerol kinase [Streptomyces lydicamycinicus]|uniref:Diacylglycerol kinase n=1 Tax=Streptomyces lydicamycinicus TaxID=1546107 RepID=A0A0P4REB6_9ACTN|nr:diacylglycerol kinase [Streptomyces lydicamycinicus]
MNGVRCIHQRLGPADPVRMRSRHRGRGRSACRIGHGRSGAMADADGSPWRSGTTWMTVTGRTVATPVAQAGQHGAPQRTPVEVGGALMCSESTRWAKYRAPGG